MSVDMRDRLRAEFADYDDATMGLSNAFGFVDSAAEWADDPVRHAEIWHEAASAAGRVETAAEEIARGARRIARTLAIEANQ